MEKEYIPTASRMKVYTTKYEPNKGYIPSDKLRVGDIMFESFSFNHMPEIQKVWKRVEMSYKKDIYVNKPIMYTDTIERVIDMFLKKEGLTMKKMKYFYFNFNHDGIDIFINRNI